MVIVMNCNLPVLQPEAKMTQEEGIRALYQTHFLQLVLGIATKRAGEEPMDDPVLGKRLSVEEKAEEIVHEAETVAKLAFKRLGVNITFGSNN